MTDQELAQAVADRLRAAEAAAEKAGDKWRCDELRKAHRLLERAHELLLTTGDVAPLSGGGPKP